MTDIEIQEITQKFATCQKQYTTLLSELATLRTKDTKINKIINKIKQIEKSIFHIDFFIMESAISFRKLNIDQCKTNLDILDEHYNTARDSFNTFKNLCDEIDEEKEHDR